MNTKEQYEQRQFRIMLERGLETRYIFVGKTSGEMIIACSIYLKNYWTIRSGNITIVIERRNLPSDVQKSLTRSTYYIRQC